MPLVVYFVETLNHRLGVWDFDENKPKAILSAKQLLTIAQQRRPAHPVFIIGRDDIACANRIYDIGVDSEGKLFIMPGITPAVISDAAKNQNWFERGIAVKIVF